MRSAIALTVTMLGTGCLGHEPLRPLPNGGVHILFVGNSLTSHNDLPGTVQAIGALNDDTVRVMRMTANNTALVDHLNGATDALAAMALGGWDWVVLQQGPTPAGICRDSLVLWAQWFAPLIRDGGAQPALFMTWPSAANPLSAFDVVRESFREAAIASGGEFLPAGEAWREAWKLDPALELYGPDGFHPSPLGSFLSALTIYERLSGSDVRMLPPIAYAGAVRLDVPQATVRLLQDAAHRANALWPSFPAPVPATSSTIQFATC